MVMKLTYCGFHRGGGGGHRLRHDGGGPDLYQWKHRQVVALSLWQAAPLPSSGRPPAGEILLLP